MHRTAFFSLALALSACADKPAADDSGDTQPSGDRDVTLQFAARVGADDVACGVEYSGVGSSGSAVQLQDLRFYVHDVVLLDDAGGETPVTLADDDLWQDGVVALLDFEDASGLCSNGTSPTNDVVVGAAPEGSYTGVRFTLGVPFELNHADPAAAETPLNLTTMHWNWQGGYKFVRLDLSTAGLPEGWFVHLGSTGCEVDSDGNTSSCAQPNRPTVELEMDPDSQVIVADLSALLEASDVDVNESGAQGCMSGLDDPECPPILERFGLSDSEQVLFRAE